MARKHISSRGHQPAKIPQTNSQAFRRVCAPFLLAILVLGAPLAQGFEAVLTDDSVAVLVGRPSNLGAKPTVAVDPKQSALFQFELSSLPPNTSASKVLSATLTVFINRVTKPGSIRLALPGGGWDEGAIPAVTLTNISGGQTAVVPANAKNSYVRFTVTDMVKGWLTDPTSNNGIAISAVDAVSLALDSKENSATAHPASLQVELVQQPALNESNKGAWVSNVAYAAGDIVSFNGSTWMANAPTTSSQPVMGNSSWSLLAQKGDTGDTSMVASTSPTPPSGYYQPSPAINVADWRARADAPSGVGAFMGVVGGNLYFFATGGTVYKYDTGQDQWTDRMAPPAQSYQAFVEAGGKIYAVGGYVLVSQSPRTFNYGRVDEYDPTTNSWTPKADLPDAAQGVTTVPSRVATALGGKIYSFGSNSTYLEVYDPITDAWISTNSIAMSTTTPLVTHNGKIYSTGADNSAIAVYDPTTDTWVTETTEWPASARILASASNGRIYLNDGDGYVNKSYDPSSDTIVDEPFFPSGFAAYANGAFYSLSGVKFSSATLGSLKRIYIRQ